MYEAMACPASYQAQYIFGAEAPPNEYSHLGQEEHDFMLAYVGHLKDEGREQDWAYFESILPMFSNEAQKILRGFIGSMRFDPRAILTTEIRFEFDDASGKPDLITLETPVDATIWDYKNYFQIIDANTFQSKLYPLLLFRHNESLETVRFVLVFMRYGITREVTWTRAQVPFLEEVLAKARAQQLNIHETEGLAEAIPGKACDYCPLLHTSRCQVNDWNPRAAMSDEERLRYAIFLQTALKSTTAILRDHAVNKEITTTDANGNLYSAGFKLEKRRTLPLRPALQVLQKHFERTGEDLSTRANISKTSLASLRNAKKRAVLNDELTAIEHVRDITPFKFSRVNPEDPEYDEAADE